MSNKWTYGFCVAVVFLIGLALAYTKHHRLDFVPTCRCLGDNCDPNPCDFMWDPSTGKVLWKR